MSSDSMDSLYIEFLADYSDLDNAEGGVSGVFAAIAESAASASENISENFDSAGKAANSFAEMSRMAAENMAEALGRPVASVDEIVSAAESGATEVSDSLGSIDLAGLQGAFDALAESVASAVSRINEQMATIPKEAKDSASSSKSAFDGFSLSGVTDSLFSAGMKFQMFGNMAQQAASSLLGPAMQAENMQEAFANLTGSTQQATQDLQQLDTFAAKTEFTTQDIDQYGAAMLGVGDKASSIVPTLTAVGDNLSAVGKGTPAEMQQVVNILDKMSTSGKLTAGDLTQLGDHGINALAAIAKGSGLSQQAISEMIKKGTLPASQAIQDMTKGIEANPIYSGGMAKQSGTLSGITSTLSSDWDQFMTKLMSPVLPELEKGLGKLTTLLTNPSFQKFATVLGTDIVNGIKTAATDISNLVEGGQKLVKFFQDNQTAMDALGAVLVATAGIITGLVLPALIGMAVDLAIVIAEGAIAAAPFVLLGIAIAAVIFGIIEAFQHWGQIMNWFGNLFGTIGSWIGTQFSRLGGWAHGLVDDIGGAFSALGSKVHDIWNGIWGDIKGAINWIIGGIDNFIGGIDSIHVNIPGGASVGFNIPKIPYLATGGYVAPGGFAIAGEAGPELVFGGTSGAHVVSAAQTAAMMQGGSNQPIYVIFQVDGKTMASGMLPTLANGIINATRSGHPIGAVA